MWPFKKQAGAVELPPYPKKSDEIELIPEELPELEGASHEESEEITELPVPNVSVRPKVSVIMVKTVTEKTPDRYISTTLYKTLLTDINDAMMQCDGVDLDVGKTLDVKEQRDEKMSALQQSLEDVGKKLMLIDSTLFGG